MGKILFSCIMFSFALVAFAAPQYNVGRSGIQINENLSLQIHVTNKQFFKNFDKFGFFVQNVDGSYRYDVFDTADAKGKEFDFGNFTSGEEVKFFAVNGKDIIDNITLKQHSNSGQYTLNVPGEDYRIQIGTGEYTGDGSSEGNTPPGQPLPGVVAALLVGGGLYGAKRMCGKKPQSA